MGEPKNRTFYVRIVIFVNVGDGRENEHQKHIKNRPHFFLFSKKEKTAIQFLNSGEVLNIRKR